MTSKAKREDDKQTRKWGNESQMDNIGEEGTLGKEVGKTKEEKVLMIRNKVGTTMENEE
jgi:hypothetical protein